MPGSEWLDISVGVVLVWFVFSLVVSATNEAINRLLAIRAKNLWQALNQLLDGKGTPRGIIVDALWRFRDDPRPSNPAPETDNITEHLYATKTVQSLENHPDPGKKTRIAHLPPAVFAQAMIEFGIRAPTGEEREIDDFIDSLDDSAPLKPQLMALWASASGDLNQFRQSVETWFDGQMQRVSALYRAKVRVVLATLGVGLAIVGFGFGLQTDALGLVTDLQRNENLRTALAATANEATAANLARLAGGGCSGETAAEQPNFQPLSLEVASKTSAATAVSLECQLRGATKLKGINLALQDDRPKPTDNPAERIMLIGRPKVLLGVLITGLAASFGSTFWYDALRRLVGLRSAASGRTAT